AAAYLAETREYIGKEKGKVLRIDEPRRLQGPPDELDQFGLDVEMGSRRGRLGDYVGRRPALGGGGGGPPGPGGAPGGGERGGGGGERIVGGGGGGGPAQTGKPVPVPPPGK